jgi:hypothetical protein
LNYGDNVDKEFRDLWFSYTGSHHKKKKPWHWRNCSISFEKLSDDIIRFIVKRNKCIPLPADTKLRWDEKQKNNSMTQSNSNYVLNYLIHFDIQIISLPKMINEEEIEEQLNDKQEYGYKKNSWVINLDNQHKIWQWKQNNDTQTKNIMMKILDAINQMKNNQYISTSKVKLKDQDNRITDILPVIYHPTRDLSGKKNYIQEIHLHKFTTENKIMITIVYNDEQLRENKLLDWVYRIFRKIRHGRTFDVESFNIILDQNRKPLQFDFPNIYSGHDNKLDKDNIHCNKCNQSIKYYFNQNEYLPILFINTSNHSMAEIDNNCNKWKIEYRLWDERCPIYVGTNSRCEIERYLAKHGIEPLFLRCNDFKYLFCIKKDNYQPLNVNT